MGSPTRETTALVSPDRLKCAALTSSAAGAGRAAAYARPEAAGLVSSYTQWHLERRLRSLQVLERSRA